MKGAIFHCGQYGSTAQYADWIGRETGLPTFDVNGADADPGEYDFLVLGSSVIIGKLTIRKWVRTHLANLEDKPTLLYTVSAAGAGEELDGWVAASLPVSLASRAVHVALRGRLHLDTAGWFVRLILKIGAWRNADPESRRHQLEGFDAMNRAGIEPIAEWVRERQRSSAAEPRSAAERPPAMSA